MYGIFTNICPINDPNVGKYTIHGAYGYLNHNSQQHQFAPSKFPETRMETTYISSQRSDDPFIKGDPSEAQSITQLI
jgi:hypothetical protein